MTLSLTLDGDPDRLFPADPATRAIARHLYAAVADLLIVNPKTMSTRGGSAPTTTGQTRPHCCSRPTTVFVGRFIEGIGLNALAIPSKAAPPTIEPRAAWRLFAANYHLFRGTPLCLWLDHVFVERFGIDVALETATAADYYYYDPISESLATDSFRPRALFDRFRIAFLATTESTRTTTLLTMQ